MEKKNFETLKDVAGIVTGSSVAYVVTSAVTKLAPGKSGLVGKAATILASLVLSAMVADKATDYTQAKITETAEEVKKAVEEIQEPEVVEEETT